jgi:hypothetical protein
MPSEKEEREDLIAYLELCAARSIGAKLTRLWNELLINSIEALDKIAAESKAAPTPHFFEIVRLSRTGEEAEILGASGHEGFALTLFDSLIAAYPGRRIILRKGAQIIRQSNCGNQKSQPAA